MDVMIHMTSFALSDCELYDVELMCPTVAQRALYFDMHTHRPHALRRGLEGLRQMTRADGSKLVLPPKATSKPSYNVSSLYGLAGDTVVTEALAIAMADDSDFLSIGVSLGVFHKVRGGTELQKDAVLARYPYARVIVCNAGKAFLYSNSSPRDGRPVPKPMRTFDSVKEAVSNYDDKPGAPTVILGATGIQRGVNACSVIEEGERRGDMLRGIKYFILNQTSGQSLSSIIQTLGRMCGKGSHPTKYFCGEQEIFSAVMDALRCQKQALENTRAGLDASATAYSRDVAATVNTKRKLCVGGCFDLKRSVALTERRRMEELAVIRRVRQRVGEAEADAVDLVLNRRGPTETIAQALERSDVPPEVHAAATGQNAAAVPAAAQPVNGGMHPQHLYGMHVFSVALMLCKK